jgi:hypothetical protein
MSRKETVLLVSRAIAILMSIPALMELLLGVPQRMWLLSQNSRPGAPAYILRMQEAGIFLTLVRIAAVLLIAMLFWRCGPAIERFLLPADSDQERL